MLLLAIHLPQLNQEGFLNQHQEQRKQERSCFLESLLEKQPPVVPDKPKPIHCAVWVLPANTQNALDANYLGKVITYSSKLKDRGAHLC